MRSTKFICMPAVGLTFVLLASPLAQATIVTFNNSAYANNSDIDTASGGYNYGSNLTLANDSPEFITSGATGATPNIGLTWFPQIANVLEFHAATTWTLNTGGSDRVLQFDLDGSAQPNSDIPPNPSILFSVTPGVAVRLLSVDMGQASDTTVSQMWTLNVRRESDNVIVFTTNSNVLAPNTQQTVQLAFTGDFGTNYFLDFDDLGVDSVRTAIDNLTFSQVAVPEPSSFGVLGLVVTGLFARRRRVTS